MNNTVAPTPLAEKAPESEQELYEARLAGWLTGYHARDSEIDRLRWEAGLWYFCANNRGKRPTDYYANVTSELWAKASL